MSRPTSASIQNAKDWGLSTRSSVPIPRRTRSAARSASVPKMAQVRTWPTSSRRCTSTSRPKYQALAVDSTITMATPAATAETKKESGKDRGVPDGVQLVRHHQEEGARASSGAGSRR